MNEPYDIKFLSNEDFDAMPASDRLGEDVSDSWGVYNPYTGQVRIRDTGFWDANKYLLDHELEHAVEEHATDTGANGLRHKKGKKLFKDIFMPLFTGFNREGQFSPLGILGKGSQQERNMERDAKDQFSSFGKKGMGSFNFSDFPSLNISGSPASTQQSQSTLNQGLNSQSVNPLDPYSQYGQESGTFHY